MGLFSSADDATKASRRVAEFVDQSDLARATARSFTPEGVVRGVTEPATSTTESVAKIGGASVVGAYGLDTAGDYFDSQGQQSEQRTIESIREDDTLSSAQKERLIEEILNEGAPNTSDGLLSSLPFIGGGGGGGGILGVDATKLLAVLVVGFIAWRLAGNTNLSLGSGSSTGSGGGS